MDVARRRGEAFLLGVLDRRCMSARAISMEFRWWGKIGDREKEELDADGTWLPVGDWVLMGTGTGTGSDRGALSEPAAASSAATACGWLACRR